MSMITRSMASRQKIKINPGLTKHDSDTSISNSEYSSDAESEYSDILSYGDSDSTEHFDSELENESDSECHIKIVIKDSSKINNTNIKKLNKEKNISKEDLDFIHNEELKINKINNQEQPLRFKVLKSELVITEKARIIKLLEKYENMETSSEYGKISQYIDTILNIPFNNYKNLNIMEDKSPLNINKFLINMKTNLDNVIYGHEKAKLEIMQILSQMISNPNSKGNILGIYGPPGIGKTTLVKEGISKILNRPFSFISLGGCSDACFLEGHSFTYEGSQPGAIVEILKKAECMNPIIYFDELDKISETTKGDEIVNQLIHLTDESQNTKITDKYLGPGIELDLSKAILIFSFNDISKINPILKDRINMIELNDFTEKDKINIANNYLLKSIYADFNIDEKNIIIKDSIYKHLFNKYIPNESGVRKLKQTLKTLVGKINMILLVDSNKDILKLMNIENIQIPIELDTMLVDKLLNNDINKNMDNYVLSSMYS